MDDADRTYYEQKFKEELARSRANEQHIRKITKAALTEVLEKALRDYPRSRNGLLKKDT